MHDDKAVDHPIGRLYGDGMGPIGICAIFKNEAPDLLEWIAYHLSIGFDHIVLFDNGSDDDGTLLVKQSVFKDFVTVIDWPDWPGQLTAYQHFTDRIAKCFEWVAFIDIDEFIHPIDTMSIRDVLPRYAGASGVSMQWLTFASSGHDRRPPGLVLENYTMRLPDDHIRCSWVKPLIRTSDLIGVLDGPHAMRVTGQMCNARGDAIRPYAQIPECHAVLVINHYYTKSMEDWLSKGRRGDVVYKNPRHLAADVFMTHQNEAAVRDDRMTRFLPIVRHALAAGPGRNPIAIPIDPQSAGISSRPADHDASPGAVTPAPSAPQTPSFLEPAVGKAHRGHGPVIHLEPNGGRLANQMIQYMVAMKLASLVPNSRISNVHLPDWDIELPTIETGGEALSINIPQRLDIDGLSGRMSAGGLQRLNYKGFGQRMENFLDREHYRGTFQSPQHRGVGYKAGHLVCHIRGDDVLRAPHPGYVIAPVEFYQEIVVQTGLHPVFVGETGPSLYMNRLLAALPSATVIPTGNIIRDFEVIRQSENIVVSCSTFSWLAAWLSDARQIILPVNGMMNPRQDSEVDLLPLDDPRYRFYLFPINHAVPVNLHPERHRLMRGLWREVSHEYLRGLLAGAPRVARRIEPFLEVFDEEYYIARFPTVRKGIADGWLPSGRVHFTNWGFKDGYGWWCFDLDEDWYTTRYPMAAFEIAQGDYADCRHHYVEIGRIRGYKLHDDGSASPSHTATPPTKSGTSNFDGTLHFVSRNSDAPVYFLPSLMAGAGHPDVVVAADNRPPPGQPYVWVLTVRDFWRLDPRRSAECDQPHFSASVDQALIEDIRSGRAILAMDLTNEGPEFEAAAFDRIHEVVDTLRLPPGRVVWLAQNRAISEAYKAAYRDTRAELMRFEYYDFYVKNIAHCFADARWRRHTLGEDEIYRRNLLDPAGKDRIALCLNATPRRHRLFAIAALRRFGLFDDCLISFGGLDYAEDRTVGDTILAQTQGNKDFSWLIEEMRTVVSLPKISVDSFEETGNGLWNRIDVAPYIRTFLSLVTEADFSSGGIDRVTEKLVKAFCLGHPTLVLGNPLSIRAMNDWGFCSFDTVFDEQYDRTLQPGARFRQVFSELNRQISSIETQPAKWLDRIQDASRANLQHSHGGFLAAYRAKCDRTIIDNFKRMLAETNPR